MSPRDDGYLGDIRDCRVDMATCDKSIYRYVFIQFVCRALFVWCARVGAPGPIIDSCLPDPFESFDFLYLRRFRKPIMSTFMIAKMQALFHLRNLFLATLSCKAIRVFGLDCMLKQVRFTYYKLMLGDVSNDLWMHIMIKNV